MPRKVSDKKHRVVLQLSDHQPRMLDAMTEELGFVYRQETLIHTFVTLFPKVFPKSQGQRSTFGSNYQN